MKTAWKIWYLLPVVLLLGLGAPCPEASAGVGVSVNINLGPPPVAVAAPPEMVMVPESRVYFDPEPGVDIFFYAGYWWSPRGDRWYRSHYYDHGWVSVAPARVPRSVIYMPRDYRTRYAHERRIPYGHWKQEHTRWDKENYQAHKRWEKEREKEWKHQDKQDRYDRYGYRQGGDHRDDPRGNGHGGPDRHEKR